MRDRKLHILVSLAMLFFLAHTIDHVARDVPWPMTTEAIPFLLATLVIFVIAFGALYLYRRGRIGPRFWAIFGALAVALGWMGHFSPFSDQPPQYIFNAYRSAAAGWLAVGSLFALMLTLTAVMLYAGMAWARGRQ
jgi:hypothetical protein